MSSRYIGGYVFVPVKQAPALPDLITLALTTLGDPGRIVGVYFSEPETPGQSRGAKMERLKTTGKGSVELHLSGLRGYVSFGDDDDGYVNVRIEVNQRDFLTLPDPEAIDRFIARWTAFCEQSGAEFGYFSEYQEEMEPGYRRDEIVIPCLCCEMDYLVKKCFWLPYLGPLLAPHWSRQGPYLRRTDSLSSGALVLHAGRGYNPIMGDGESEA